MENWYAVYTRPRHEKKVYESLREMKWEAFLPMVTRVRLWKDRKKKVAMPLFSSYLFARFDYKYRYDLLHISGVVKIVNFKGTPAVVPEWQIDALKQMLKNPEKLQLENYMRCGQEIEVIDGVFKGMRGAVKVVKGTTRLLVTIEGIQQTVSVELDSSYVKKIEKEDG